MRDMAATVSVAERTELRSKIYVRDNALKKMLSRKYKNVVKDKNPMIVPIIPRNVIIPKFSKKRDFLRLYPAEKIIGGNMMVKNI
jgi:hypothetical protein